MPRILWRQGNGELVSRDGEFRVLGPDDQGRYTLYQNGKYLMSFRTLGFAKSCANLIKYP